MAADLAVLAVAKVADSPAATDSTIAADPPITAAPVATAFCALEFATFDSSSMFI